MTGVLFFAIPPTCDYIKRDYYVKMFPEDLKQYNKAKSAVDSILKEKMRLVTFEMVLRSVFKLNLDRPL